MNTPRERLLAKHHILSAQYTIQNYSSYREPQLEFMPKLGQRALREASREESNETQVEQTRETRIPRVFQGVTDFFTHARSRVFYKRALSMPASCYLGRS